MHYYKRNIGDYHKKAGRLSILQHGVYTLLIDACYDREVFPTLDDALDWVWASSDAEVDAVKFVLKKFFVEDDGFYIQNRIKEDLDKYHANSLINKRIAIEREKNKKKTKGKGKGTNREPIVNEKVDSTNEAPPNQEPLTINQEPLTKVNSSLQKNEDSPVCFELSLNDNSLFDVTEKQCIKWSSLYPAVDIDIELRKITGWLDANPTKRKTRKGVLRFVNNWLSKAQDSGRSNTPSPTSQYSINTQKSINNIMNVELE